EEMVEAAKALTDPDADVYGMSLAAGSYTENNHFAFINATQNGAALNDADGNPTFTEDGVVDGILRYLDLMQEHKVVNPSNAQFDEGTKSVTAFADKKAAMIINQNNANATIESQGMDPEEVKAIPFPAAADPVQAARFLEIHPERPEPLPLVQWEAQFQTTGGQAMNGMFATIATVGSVPREDVLTHMQPAQDSIRA